MSSISDRVALRDRVIICTVAALIVAALLTLLNLATGGRVWVGLVVAALGGLFNFALLTHRDRRRSRRQSVQS